MQQDRVAELSGGHEHPAKDQTGGAGVAALHPVHMHKAKDGRLQHNRRDDASLVRRRPGHHGDVLRPRATPTLPERTALRVKCSERKLKNNTAHQQLLAKRSADHRGQDGQIARVAHARLLDKFAVIGRRLGQQRQHGVGHVANDHLHGQTDHDNADDALPCRACSPTERALALPARHEGAGPQIAPPQQRHQIRRRLSGSLEPLNIEIVDRIARQHRQGIENRKQNHAQGYIGSDNAKTGKCPNQRIEHANLLKTVP